MRNYGFLTRCRTVVQAWPLPGAIFLVLSFLVSAVWLYDALFGLFDEEIGWFEPLAAILGGLGAFILAAILIFRRVDSARAAASKYDLARGLATGYYFNYVRPVVEAIHRKEHPLHEIARGLGAERIVAVAVGIPQKIEDFDPERHPGLYAALTASGRGSFVLSPIDIPVAKRPRPIATKLAVCPVAKVGIVVDIPTTLAVIADFARHVAERDASAVASEDEFIAEARRNLVASAESDRFRFVLEEFVKVVNDVGAQESDLPAPALLLHVVSVDRLRKRLDELADH
jgi:hypothetical protein